jgi:hypothetical protein
MFSIDDQMTRGWLELTSKDDNRADYFVIYPDEELETLYFDIVEIKTHDDVSDQTLDWSDAERVSTGSDGDNDDDAGDATVPESAELRGKGLKQAIKTSRVIEQIFSDTNSPIVPPRREALRQQLFYELDEFLESYSGDRLDLVDLFNQAFNPETDIVEVQPRTVVVDLEEISEENQRYKGWYTSSTDEEDTVEWDGIVQADVLSLHDVYEIMQADPEG